MALFREPKTHDEAVSMLAARKAELKAMRSTKYNAGKAVKRSPEIEGARMSMREDIAILQRWVRRLDPNSVWPVIKVAGDENETLLVTKTARDSRGGWAKVSTAAMEEVSGLVVLTGHGNENTITIQRMYLQDGRISCVITNSVVDNEIEVAHLTGSWRQPGLLIDMINDELVQMVGVRDLNADRSTLAANQHGQDGQVHEL